MVKTKKTEQVKIEKKKEKTNNKKKTGEEHLKILAIGDLHGDTRQAERLAEKAQKEKVDLVILSGDLTLADQSADYLVGPFAKRKLKVFIIPGNHEILATTDFLANVYKPYVKSIHGEGLKLKNMGLFGAGGANIGLFQMSEQEIYGTLKKGFDKIKDMKKRIMITHVHPSGTLMAKLTDIFPGSTGVRHAIERFQPDIAICSHVHEAENIEERIGKTKVFNVGSRGKIITI